MSNITDVVNQLDPAGTNYQISAVLIMNILLLLERIFKNGKFFVKCSRAGLSCGTRSPPATPKQSNNLNSDESPPPVRKKQKKQQTSQESSPYTSDHHEKNKNTRSKSRSIDLE